MMTKVKYNERKDILMITLSDEPVEYSEKSREFVIHFSRDRKPVLVEILSAENFLIGVMLCIAARREVPISWDEDEKMPGS